MTYRLIRPENVARTLIRSACVCLAVAGCGTAAPENAASLGSAGRWASDSSDLPGASALEGELPPIEEIPIPGTSTTTAPTTTIGEEAVVPCYMFRLNDVVFDTGNWTLKPDADNALQIVVDAMTVRSVLLIEGHADKRPSAIGNIRLSELRAEAVKTRLIDLGLLAARDAEVIGYGDAFPLDDSETPHAYAVNRRVEITILCSEIK